MPLQPPAAGPSPQEALASGQKADSQPVHSAAMSPPERAPRALAALSVAFPGPSKAGSQPCTHTCHDLRCLSPTFASPRQAGASVLSVLVTPCRDLFPHQCASTRWGFSSPGSQLAHLFVHSSHPLAVWWANPGDSRGWALGWPRTAQSLLVELVSQHS